MQLHSSSSRREFLKSSGTAALAMTAASYARVVGANDRISIGQIGCGNRTAMYGTQGVMDFTNRRKPKTSGAGAYKIKRIPSVRN